MEDLRSRDRQGRETSRPIRRHPSSAAGPARSAVQRGSKGTGLLGQEVSVTDLAEFIVTVQVRPEAESQPLHR